MVILLLVNLGTARHFHVLRTVYSFSPYNYQNCVRKRARILCSPTDYRTVTFIAIRDISVNEELLCHYGSFVKNGRPGWKKLKMSFEQQNIVLARRIPPLRLHGHLPS